MIEVVLVDMRSRELIIKGQEVLTADKVALRVSIVAQFAVIDPKAAVHAVESYQGRLYSDVQLAARRTLVRMPLEEILTNLNRLSSKILEDVKEIAAGYGVNIARADVRDLSFPGNVQELMNRVFIDRTNIAMAIPAMRTELGLSASAIGFATGTFFRGYIILQIPAGRIAAVWSAKWVILSLLLFWSLVSLSTAYVRTENELVLNRFCLDCSKVAYSPAQ